MAKRGSNIYKRKDGRFEGRVPVGYRENGTKKYRSVYGKTLSEVKDKMAELYSIKSEKTVSTMKLTVDEVAEQWLSAARLRVKESSYANYENILNRHILPMLGGEYFSALNASRINEFIHFKLTSGRLNGKGGLSARSVRDIMTVYRSIESYAAHEYGLRVGELCGLKWEDFDFDNDIFYVKRTVQRVSRNGRVQLVRYNKKSNNIPKVCLDFRTPNEVLQDHLYVM